MAIHVIFAGARTTVQDKGRLGYQNSGFAPNGFIDRFASHMANALVNNDENEAVLEFCLVGPILTFDEEANIAVCGGDFSLKVGSRTYPAGRAVHIRPGETVQVVTGQVGTFGSLAIGGGLDIPLVMGSRSTNVRCGIGGYKGRALENGDVIKLRNPKYGKQNLEDRRIPARTLPTEESVLAVRVIPGPQEDAFTEEGIKTFYGSEYEMTNSSDRMGFRLDGPEVASKHGSDILSDGIVLGSIQISGKGKPIVMMADRQTTGGYAKIATIINVDIPTFAQLRPGQKVRFVRCTVEEAQEAYRDYHKKWKAFKRSQIGPLFDPRKEEQD